MFGNSGITFRTILIYGGETVSGRETLLGSALTYYLGAYADLVGKSMSVTHGVPTPNAASAEAFAWDTYVGMYSSSRPDLIIDISSIGMLRGEISGKKFLHPYEAACIAMSARAANIPLLYISTDRVFKGDKGPYDVYDRRHPVSDSAVAIMCAEDAIMTIHPKGSTILRISSTFKDPSVSESGECCSGSVSSFTFIGHVGFLIARNIIHSPHSIVDNLVIHCAPTIPTSFAAFTAKTELAAQHHPTSNVFRTDGYVCQASHGKSGGLKPTSGWVLPTYAEGISAAMREKSSKTKHLDFTKGIQLADPVL